MDSRLILYFMSLLVSFYLHGQQVDYRSQFKAMGSAFEVVVVAGNDSAQWADTQLKDAESEIRRIEKLISSWDPNSQTSRLNDSAGIGAVMLDAELVDLIWRSKGIHEMTGGAFDITYASMAHAWNFSPDKRTDWPDSLLVDSLRTLVSTSYIDLLFDGSVSIQKRGTKIGFGGIGKGYAADRAAKLIQAQGVRNGVINASGDIYAWGHDEHGDAWRVAIVDPKDKNKIKMWLQAEDQAVVTSGDYEKYKILNGVRYAHIINPSTGYPVSGIASTTVVANRAELADALATAIFVMGREKGLELINSLNGTECIIIDDHGEIWYSDNIDKQSN